MLALQCPRLGWELLAAIGNGDGDGRSDYCAHFQLKADLLQTSADLQAGRLMFSRGKQPSLPHGSRFLPLCPR